MLQIGECWPSVDDDDDGGEEASPSSSPVSAVPALLAALRRPVSQV